MSENNIASAKKIQMVPGDIFSFIPEPIGTEAA